MEKRHVMRTLLAAGALTAALTACGGSPSKYSAADTVSPQMAMTEEAYDYDGGVVISNGVTELNEAMEAKGYDDAAGEIAVDAPQDALAGRKLIKNVNLNVETEQFDVLVPGLENRIAALGGYIEDMSSYSRNDHYSSDYVGTRYLRYASMTVRIPKQNLDAFLDEVGEQSNIVSRSENVTDVTLQYVDLESHKKALTTEQSRLLQLMEQAESVEDIITIESRLSEVRYQLESMESQLRTYDNKIDYSTVYLYIDEVERYTPTEEVTTGERIRTGFMDSLRGVGRGIGNFAIWFVVNLPYLAVWAVIIIVIVLIVRLIIKAAAKRRTKRAAKRVSPYPVQPQNPYQQGMGVGGQTAVAQPDAANAGAAAGAREEQKKD